MWSYRTETIPRGGGGHETRASRIDERHPQSAGGGHTAAISHTGISGANIAVSSGNKL
jgi:hypothetical protein